VRDPLGGINSLWPLFGIANQLLAAVALCLGTTIILKMTLRDGGRWKAAPLVTLIPLAWLLSVTMTAGYQKIFDPAPRIGFLAAARDLDAKKPALEQALTTAESSGDPTAIASARKALTANRTLHFNNTLDAVVAGAFLVMVTFIVLISIREWLLLLGRRRPPQLHETEPVWLPGGVAPEPSPLGALGAVALGVALLKEVSGEAAIAREQVIAEACDCVEAQTARGRRNVYLTASTHRFTGVTRCC